MEDRKFRFVQAGCGGMGKNWLKLARECGQYELVGLVDIDTERATAIGAEYGIAPSAVFRDIREALEKTSPDVVFDVTVPEAHASIVIPALEYGCHVLGEKPMSDRIDDARKMVAAAEKSGRLYAVTQTQRNRQALQALAEFCGSGKIGTIEELHLDFFIGAHFGGFRDAMADVLLMDMSIHHFDAARAVSGKDAVSVWCQSWSPKRSWYSGDGNAIAVFEMTDDVVFSYRGSWCAEGVNTGWHCNWRIVGSKGSVVWTGGDTFQAERVADMNQQKFIRDAEPLAITVNKDRPEAHLGYLLEFAHCLRTGSTPQTIASDNIKSLEMVFAAVQSAHTGTRVQCADL